MRIEMWPPWGGVIGDKVTLMFRLFNTHLFTPHLLCRHLKSGFFSLGKSNVPRKGTQWHGLGVSNVLQRVHSCQRYIAVSQLLTFCPIVNFFPRFCIAAAPFYVSQLFSSPSQSDPCGRTWASICPNLLICMFLQNSSFAHG